MSGIEEMINGVLSDPEQMKKLTSMAQSIMGGAGGEPLSLPESGGGMPDWSGLLGKLPPGILKAASGFLGGGRSGGGTAAVSGDKTELLNALSPWLSEKRRAKLERSIRLAGFLKLGVGVFFGSGGGK